LFVELVGAADLQDFLERPVRAEARVLPIRASSGGHRHRSWESIANDSRLEDFSDWPLPLPRTVPWCLDFLRREAETIERHHERFRSVCKLDSQMWGVSEHFQLCQILKLAGEYDQNDLANSAAFEAVFRRIQTIEYSYLERARDQDTKTTGGKLTAEEQLIFAGTTRSHTALMIAPALLEHVRQEAEREASLAKNLVKAREAREALLKKK